VRPDWYKICAGILAALGSTAIILGGLTLSLSEGLQPQTQTGQPAPTSGMAWLTALARQTAATQGATQMPSPPGFTLPADCIPPEDWQPVTVQTGDTLLTLASRYQTTPNEIARANCLIVSTLIPGSVIYVPLLPPTDMATIPSPTSVLCGPPPGWTLYTVQPEDNLFRIGLAYGVTVAQLQFANCLGNSSLIRAGDRLWVPDVPTRTPRPSLTFTPTKTKPPATPTERPQSPPPQLPQRRLPPHSPLPLPQQPRPRQPPHQRRRRPPHEPCDFLRSSWRLRSSR
jgi:LysM repeat protein